MLSFLVLKSLHTYAHSHLIRGSKWTHNSLKKQSYFSKKCSLWRFISEMKVTCMLYFCWIFWLLIIIVIFFSSLVVTYVCTSHPNRGSKWTHKSQKKKNSTILLKKIFFKFIFWNEGHANCYVYILTIYLQCLLFTFSDCNMCYAHAHPNKSLNWTHHWLKNWSCFAKKCSFWSVISKMKVSFMPISSFIFSLFKVNTFFFSS